MREKRVLLAATHFQTIYEIFSEHDEDNYWDERENTTHQERGTDPEQVNKVSY